MALKDCIENKASNIQEFWFDVDGVMTPQGKVVIYEMLDRNGHVVAYERHDGLLKTPLVPLDTNGMPILNKVEYFATAPGQPIAEGYGFDPRDGKVVEYLVQNGFPVYFISGRNSPVVRERANALGAMPILGEKDKLVAMKKLTACPFENIMFIGDGIQDCEVLGAVGLSIAPKDACPEAIATASCITDSKGGEGVLSEVLTIFLKARGLWPHTS